jgi:hypothetical protein
VRKKEKNITAYDIKICFSFTCKKGWQKWKASDRTQAASRHRKRPPLLLQNGHVAVTTCFLSRKLRVTQFGKSRLSYNHINSLLRDKVRFHFRSSDVDHSVQSIQDSWIFTRITVHCQVNRKSSSTKPFEIISFASVELSSSSLWVITLREVV